MRKRNQSKKTISKKISGLLPGTLVYTGEQTSNTVEIEAFVYHAEGFEEKSKLTFDELKPLIKNDASGCLWVNINGLYDTALIENIGKLLSINHLTLEDIVHVEQRAKLEIYPNYLFLVLNVLEMQKADSPPDSRQLATDQISFVLTKNCLVTFQDLSGDVFEAIRNHIRQGKGSIRSRKVDYLLYALMDCIIDNDFHLLQTIADNIDALEVDILSQPEKQNMTDLFQLKKQVIQIRKTIYPVREIVNEISRDDVFFMPDTKPFLRDLYDHCFRAIDHVELSRENLTALLELYMSQQNNKMNEIIKTLTIISTIFIPLTFIVGVYGMNFDVMPELRWANGYYVVWGIMLATALGLVFYFIKKKWL